MKSGDDYRLLRLTETQKAVSGPDNASKHIGIVSKHRYKHVICVWGVVGSFPGVQAAKNGQKRSNVTLTKPGVGAVSEMAKISTRVWERVRHCDT